MLPSTGERLIPWDTQHPSAHYEHLQRYYFAAEFCRGRKVLELGSGEGYGASILAETAADFVGVDVSSEAVRWAEQKYGRPTLRFICASASSVPLAGRELFDVVVCFEMIEHISEHESLLREITRLLKPGGLLIISTPNKMVYTDQPDFHNPFHVRELYIEEFNRLIEASFPHVAYLGQRFHAALTMWPMNRVVETATDVVIEKQGDRFVKVAGERKVPMYVVAVASRQPFSQEVNALVARYSVLLDISDAYVKTLQQAYTAQIHAADDEARAQAQRAEAAEAKAAELHRQLTVRNAELSGLRARLKAIQNSRLWKIAGPLQKLPSVFKRQTLRDAARIESCGLFSSQWYLDRYPDVREAGIPPALHYVSGGWRENRNPHWLFDTRWYMERYGKELSPATNPLLHFLQHAMDGDHVPHPAFENWNLPKPYRQPLLEYFVGKSAGMTGLAAYNGESPEVSIVILNLNKSLLTLQCLASLWKHTRGCQYEIIVVDNGSRPEDLALLKGIEGPFQLIEVGCNRFFGEGNNIGAESARGRYLVFLNNDVVATAGWLEPLIQAVSTNPGCGAAGPKFVYPSGKLQEAGASIRPDGTAEQIGNGKDPADPQYNRESPVAYVSAAAVAMKKETFEKVRGFDFCWEPAYYEDVDLCFKIAALNLKTYYIPASTIIHIGSATAVDPSHGLQLDNIVEINRRKFLDRWHAYLSSGDLEAAKPLLRQQSTRKNRPRSGLRSRVALFTPFNIIPGGGERVLLSVAEALLDTYEVVLVTPQPYSRMRVETVARMLEIDIAGLAQARLCDLKPEDVFEVWIALGNQIVPPIAAQGKTNIYLLQFPFPISQQQVRASRAVWAEYQHIAVYSQYVASHVASSAQRYGLEPRPIHVIYPPADSFLPPGGAVKNQHSILSVGRFFAGGHCKRQDLMIAAFKKLLRHFPHLQLELHLAGSLHPERQHRDYLTRCKELAEGLPVYFHVDILPSELAALYRSSSIYWHATGLDADLALQPERAEHFGITVVESMSAGCIPIVYHCGGPTEIVQDQVNGFHFQDTDGLIAATARVITQSGEAWVAQMRAAAVSRSQDFSKAAHAEAWRGLAAAGTPMEPTAVSAAGCLTQELG